MGRQGVWVIGAVDVVAVGATLTSRVAGGPGHALVMVKLPTEG